MARLTSNPTPTCFMTRSRMDGRISFEEKNVFMVGSTAFIAVACAAIKSAWNPSQFTWHSSFPCFVASARTHTHTRTTHQIQFGTNQNGQRLRRGSAPRLE